jgi:gamma-glutamylcysteine synthetase
MLNNIRKELKHVGLITRGSAPRSAPRSAMIRPTLAGHKNRILKDPKYWIEIAPIALTYHLQRYKNAQELSNGTNDRSKFIKRVNIKKNKKTTMAHEASLEKAKMNLLRAMENHSNNLTSVIMRLIKANDPNKLKELLKQEKRAKQNPNLLPLSGAIKQAISASEFWNSYIPPPQVNFSEEQVNKLKKAKLLNLSNDKIDIIVEKIRLKIPRK